MDSSCLHYRLTDQERRTFEERGLLMIENALSPEQVAALTSAVDRVYRHHLSTGHDPHKWPEVRELYE